MSRPRIRPLMLLAGSLAMFSVAVTTQRVPVIALLAVLPLLSLRAGRPKAVAPDSSEPEDVR